MSAVQRLSLPGGALRGRSYEVLTVMESAVAGGLYEQGCVEGRFVRVVLTGPAEERVVDEHLRVGLHAPPRRRRLADVLVGCGGDVPRPGGVCAECTGRASTVWYPGAMVVAEPQGAECVLHYGAAAPCLYGTGALLTLGDAHRARAPWNVWASAAHAWLVAGWPMDEFGTLPDSAHRLP